MKTRKTKRVIAISITSILMLAITFTISKFLCLNKETVYNNPVIADTNKIIKSNNPAETESDSNDYGYKVLDIEPVLQNPELPTGCEITALTTVLNYYGCSTDKIYLAENYLEQGAIGETNPNEKFIGSPFSSEAYGCYENVIENSAKKFISDNNFDLSVTNLTNTDFSSFDEYLDSGCPVIFWVTIDLIEPYSSTTWIIDNKEVTWLSNEHCMVLIGYDNSNDSYIVSDPLRGIEEYPKELLIKRYNQMGKQAILINAA